MNSLTVDVTGKYNEVFRFHVCNREQHIELCNRFNRWLEKVSRSTVPVNIFKVDEQQAYPFDMVFNTAELFEVDKESVSSGESPFDYLSSSVRKLVLRYAIKDYNQITNMVKDFKGRNFNLLCRSLNGFEYSNKSFRAINGSVDVCVVATNRGYEVSPIINNIKFNHNHIAKDVDIEYCRKLLQELNAEA